MSSTKLRDELAALRIDRSSRTRSSRARGAVVGVVALLIVAGAGAAGLVAFRDRLTPAPAVKVETVRVISLGQVNTVLTATGYLESRQQASVGAKAPGRVARVLVDEGDKVQKGDLLAELEHADLDAILNSRQVAVQYAEAQLNEAKNTATQRERDYAREQSVFGRGAGTQAALENAETEYRGATARVEALTASVAVAKAQVREAEEAIANLRVYAPFAGTVVTKDAEVGETIMPGGMGLASGRGAVATLANLDLLEVDTDVKEDYLGGLEKGQPAEVTVDAVPGRTYRGTLREIIPMGDRTRGIVKVKVKILDPDEHLFPELSATVHFQPARQDRPVDAAATAMFVSSAAIAMQADQAFVWRVEQGRAARVKVTRQEEGRDGLVSIKGNLAGGDQVIVDPPADLADGARVRVLE